MNALPAQSLLSLSLCAGLTCLKSATCQEVPAAPGHVSSVSLIGIIGVSCEHCQKARGEVEGEGRSNLRCLGWHTESNEV
mmetsp:Transcript_1966/g.3578  ORF Transcript_1966/g.3578 Transcript_1966/m.3578 type:complete len:80 (+) Transcript_1966:1169-1408(+)